MAVDIIQANDQYGNYCLIPVYKNWEVQAYAMVDPEDFENLSQYKWSLDRGNYAKRSLSKAEKREKGRHGVSMHVQLMREYGLLTGESNLSTNLVDHRNNVRLDNRKLNLRVVDKYQNGWNRGKSKNNTSGYKGVVIRYSEYRAQFHKKRDGKSVTLVGGGYLSAYEASRAYDLMVLANVEFDFIRLNHPIEDYDYKNLTWEGMTLDELKQKGAQDRKNYIAIHGKLPVIPKPEKKKVETSTPKVIEEPVFDIFEDLDGLGEYIELEVSRHKRKIKISPDDYPWISEYNWTYKNAKHQGYAVRKDSVSGKDVFMHREILLRQGYDLEDLLVDHKNQDKHDNRRLNLRPATKAQNCCNTSIVRGKVNYKGVQRYKDKYISLIQRGMGKSQEPLIITDDPVKAAMAYDLASLETRGEFASINFPDYDYSGMTLKQFLWDHRAEKYDSGYKGVSRCNKDPLVWIAGIGDKDYGDNDIFLGRYDTEVDAAIAYDLKELEIRGKTSNFSPDNYPDGKYQGMTVEQWAERKLLERHIKRPELARKQRKGSSGYLGVMKNKKKWFTGFMFNWEQYSTGKFYSDRVEAAIEVDRLRLEVCREWAVPKLNFHLSNYMDLVEAYNLHEFIEMMPVSS